MNLKQLATYNTKYHLKDSIFPVLISNYESVLFYYPEIGKDINGNEVSTIKFINKFRKKGIFNEILILPRYRLDYKIQVANKYIQEFKKINPTVKIVPKFKTFQKNKLNVVDLQIISELFFILAQKFSKFKALKEVFEFINNIVKDNNLTQDKILFIELSDTSLFFNTLYKFFRRNGLKVSKDVLNIDYIFILTKTDNDEYDIYPLCYSEKNQLILRQNIYNLIQREYFNINIEEEVSKEEKIKIAKENLLNQYQELKKDYVTKLLEKPDKKLENTIDNIYQTISEIDVPGKTIPEKINNLFKDEKDEKIKNKVTELIKYLEELNKKYNGVIEINENLINKTADIFYDPVKITGLKELTVYNRQKTEFDEVLDNSMIDLIKSIEKSNAGIKVLDIKIDIEDTNKDRLKIYEVKLKNTKHGYNKPYTIKIKVPYPIKGKYLKIGGINYIMINQFYPKPLLKVKPNIVRLYTHFNTFTVSLNTSSITETEDLKNIFDKMISLNKKTKIEFIDNSKLNKIKDEFGINIEDNLINKKIEL